MSVDKRTSHRLEVAPAAAELASPLFLLDQGDLCLLVSGSDIASLAAATQITAAVDAQSCGLVPFEQGAVPVFCINKNLQLNAQLPTTHTALVILQEQGFYFALACIDVIKLTGEALVNYSVPTSMSSRKQPFTDFAIIGNRAAGFTNAASLAELLRSRGVSFALGNARGDKEAANG